MSYIPKPTHQKRGASTTAAHVKSKAPLEISLSTLSSRTRSLHTKEQPHQHTTLSSSKEVNRSFADESPLPSQSLRIHHCKNGSIVRLFPFDAASQSRANNEGRRLDDSAIGIQDSSCTYPALGLDSRPVSAEQRVPTKADRISTRYRSVSDSHSSTENGAAVVAATSLHSPTSQDIQNLPPSDAPTKLVRRKTISAPPKTGGSGSQAKPTHRSSHATHADEFRPWAAKEVDFMAKTSMRYWTSDQTVNYNVISRELDRPQKEIRTMLRLMLLEYRLFAHKLHWPLENEVLVKRWAAAEFPKCPTLNHAKSPSSRHTVGFANVDRCISALRCNGQAVDSADFFANTKNTESSGADPNTVPQPVPANGCKKPGFEFNTESSSVPNSTSQSVNDAIEAIAALTFAKHPQSPATRATRKVLSSNRKDVNILSRNSRVQRAHGRHRGSTTTTHTSGAEDSYTKCNIAAPSEPRQEDLKKPPETKRVSFGAIDTIIEMEARSLDSKPSVLSAPAKPQAELEKIELNPDCSKDTELSPEQSTDTCDFNRLDGDIDMRFFDVTAVSRKYIRSFVDRYTEKFFDSFFCRIAHPRIEDGDRLCLQLERCLDDDVSLADDDLLVRLQKEILTFDAFAIAEGCGSGDIKSSAGGSSGNVANIRTRLAKASLHFHMCLSRAVEECKIYKGDANWPSANDYATSVFNRAIEDAHYLVFEGHRGVSEYSSGSGLSAIQYMRTEDMAGRANQFKRAYYMRIVSNALVSRYVQNDGRQTLLKRIEIAGIHPVPTALEFDDNLSEEELESELETPWSDVSIRGELHNLIMEVMPCATNKSTMLAMQQAIEVYNKTIVIYNDGLNGELSRAFDKSTRAIDLQAKNREIVELLKDESQATMSVETTCKVAECLAELWFDRLKMGVLRALMVDHSLMPVSLSDIRRWIIEDRSPGGRNIDFALNSRLYNYLKYSRVRLNEAKWLYASGAATLRMIELATMYLQNKHLLEHISVDGCANVFSSHIHALVGQAASSKHASDNESIQPKGVNNLTTLKPSLPREDTLDGINGRRIRRASASINEPDADPERDLKEAQTRLENLVQNTVPSNVAHSLSAATPHPSWKSTPLQAVFVNDDKQSTGFRDEKTYQKSAVIDPGSGAEARISGLETEITKIRQEMRDIAEMHRDINSIVGMLYNRYSGTL
ncbi:hypothetical protein IW140_004155 [Coemansia sp. RSA 1813]|nr:hypothetical protein EV178_004143 [Coemansia sp. RSA 1646]KAJ1770933.1 hypothetical protein LPJ74_002732 [Coemansia sp. RSA 1843]KAJ2088252.1 hypothetical protein IW138_004328 [Coemansia sp. RSA 986]KAJ2213262.1 hypothetical protein EV179_003953 [Coemansia sp. RSA 487]KAJ2568157.1 hypothetical protein IW140_004155 [Coemansia sp. RSA 1813]